MLGDLRILPRSAGKEGLAAFDCVLPFLFGGGVLRSGSGFGISSSGMADLEVGADATSEPFALFCFFSEVADGFADGGNAIFEFASEPGAGGSVVWAFVATAAILFAAGV